MTRTEKRKRSSKIYWACLIIYTVLLIAAAVYGLTTIWAYAEEYELSRPNNTMDEYVATLSENLWGDGIAETVSNMAHEVQSDEEVAEHVKQLLKNGISYVRKGSSDGTNAAVYSLRCNGNEFGTVRLVEDESYSSQARSPGRWTAKSSISTAFTAVWRSLCPRPMRSTSTAQS